MVSIVHVRVTVVPAPIASLAKTSSVLSPSGSPVAPGAAEVTPALLHDCVPPLKRQQIVDGSLEVTVKLVLDEFCVLPCAGPAVMLTVGRIVSITHVWLAGVASALPAASMAKALKVWLPSTRLG